MKWTEPLSSLFPTQQGQKTTSFSQHNQFQRESELSRSASIITLSASDEAELAQLSANLIDLDMDFEAQELEASEYDSLDDLDCGEDSALDDYDFIKWTEPNHMCVTTTAAKEHKPSLQINIDNERRPISRYENNLESPRTPRSPTQSQSDMSSLFGAECTLCD